MLRLLGAPVFESQAGRWVFRAERPFQLLTVLAARGDWIDRDRLAALFWPEQPNDDARRNLRRVLHGARRAGPPVEIESRGDLLRWPVATDLALFDAALREGRRSDAAALVRGPFAAGLDEAACAGFQSWLVSERARIHALAHAAPIRTPDGVVDPACPAADGSALREREIDALCQWWNEGPTGPLVVVGPHGVGKRWLVRAFAQRIGCRVVSLAAPGVASADHLGPRAVLALRGPAAPPVPPAHTGPGAPAARCLLVLDAGEPWATRADARKLNAALERQHDGAGASALLVTARTAPALEQARTLRLAPLEAPADASAAALAASPAARLFLARARAVHADFDGQAHRRELAAVCRAAAGLPLAIELLAACLVRDAFDALAAACRAGAPALHAGADSALCGAIELAWRSAAPDVREVWQRLSVMVGGFTLDAARAVAGATLATLANLVDASLLQAEACAGASRFIMHPRLREFAAERLALQPEPARQAAALHAAYFTRRLASLAGRLRREGKASPESAAVLVDELNNAVAAWRRASSDGDAALLATMAPLLADAMDAAGWQAEALALLHGAPAGRHSPPA